MIEPGGMGADPGGAGLLHHRDGQELGGHVDIGMGPELAHQAVAHHAAHGARPARRPLERGENRLHRRTAEPFGVLDPPGNHAASSPSATARKRRVRLAVMPQMRCPS